VDMYSPTATVIDWILDEPTGQVGFNKQFAYRRDLSDSGQRHWWLVFYERHVFRGRISTAQDADGSASGEAAIESAD